MEVPVSPGSPLEKCQQALRACSMRFHNLIDRNSDGLLVVCRDGVIRYANSAAEHLLGRRATDLQGQVFGVPVIPGETTEVDIPHGSELKGVAEMRVTEIEWEGKLAYLASLRDITERYHANEALCFLAEASQVFARTLDYPETLRNVAHMAVSHLADWCMVDILEDRQIQRTAMDHGDPRKEGLLHQLQERFEPDWEAEIGLPHVLQTGRSEIHTAITEILLRTLVSRPEQTAIAREVGCRSLMIVPLLRDDRPVGAITFVSSELHRRFGPSEQALAEDLARRAALSLENARLYRQTREAVRRRDEFLAMLAHELRNPLAPIRTSLQLLREAMPSEEFRRVRDIMNRQVEHMVRLIDDLLDVSRVTSGKIRLQKERVDLEKVVARAVETARPLIEAQRHQFELTLPTEPVYVEADVTRLAQVVGNLLNNAAKYTDQGGRIALQVECDGRYVLLHIRDTGIGIAPDLLPHVFDLFTQADRSLDRSQGGLGLGLALVRSLTEMHGGSVLVHSDGPGKGSTFTVRLPVLEPPCPESPARTETSFVDSARAAEPPWRRVLVVDDNVDAAQCLALLLQLQQCEVRTAHDGATALKLADSFQPDLVLLDIGLPGMNGYDVARRLREQTAARSTLLVAVTGYGREEDVARSRQAGFDRHLVKPVDPTLLQKLLLERK